MYIHTNVSHLPPLLAITGVSIIQQYCQTMPLTLLEATVYKPMWAPPMHVILN